MTTTFIFSMANLPSKYRNLLIIIYWILCNAVNLWKACKSNTYRTSEKGLDEIKSKTIQLLRIFSWCHKFRCHKFRCHELQCQKSFQVFRRLFEYDKDKTSDERLCKNEHGGIMFIGNGKYFYIRQVIFRKSLTKYHFLQFCFATILSKYLN